MKTIHPPNRKAVKGVKRLFFKLGSCSRTLGYILNREFGHLSELHERALDPLAGGIIQQGYQCGMLWGAALAVGAEACRRSADPGKATALAIQASGAVHESFVKRTNSSDCYDITSCDWTKKGSILKYMITGRVTHCYKLMAKWAPYAIESAEMGLSQDPDIIPSHCRSCASEVVKLTGGTPEEQAMVAGFAGGIALSGNACGALGATIWMQTLRLIRENPEGKYFFHPAAKELLERFYKKTSYEILCREITGSTFAGCREHTAYLDRGGCADLIAMLGKT